MITNVKKKKLLHVGCMIEYNIDDKLIGQSGLIGWISNDIIGKMESWVDNKSK